MPTEYAGWEWQRQQFKATDRECNKLRAEIASLKQSQEVNFQGLLQRINELEEQNAVLTERLDKAAGVVQQLKNGGK